MDKSHGKRGGHRSDPVVCVGTGRVGRSAQLFCAAVGFVAVSAIAVVCLFDIHPARVNISSHNPPVATTSPYLYDNDGSMAVGADIAQVKGLTGRGVIVAIADTGIAQQGDRYHDDLPSGRILDQYYFKDWWTGADEEAAVDTWGHGTHVAGIIGGSGLHDPLLKGMAPETSLLVYRMVDPPYAASVNEISRWMHTTRFEDITRRAALHNADVFNNSWGGSIAPWDTYNEYCTVADRAVRGEYMNADGRPQCMNVVVAAGSDKRLIGSPALAKNVITVGAICDGNSANYGWPPGKVADFSNYGPVDTGSGKVRTKPDVVAPGVNITSTIPWYLSRWNKGVGNYYAAQEGTSMGAPYVSGAIALLLQKYPDVKTWPEKVKARIINTAVPLGNGVEKEGHGMIDVYHMLYDDDSFRALLWEGSDINVQTPERLFYFDVPAGFKEVRTTLVWSDRPGTSEIANDLDFSVYDRFGSLVGGSSSCGDNVKHVVISRGEPGIWKLAINKTRLTEPKQDFAVCVSAVLAEPSLTVSVHSDRAAVRQGEELKFTIELADTGYTAAGSYMSVAVPADFYFNCVDIYKADGTKYRYDISDINFSVDTYNIAVGEVVCGNPRKAEWVFKARDILVHEKYTFRIGARARNTTGIQQSIMISKANTPIVVCYPPQLNFIAQEGGLNPARQSLYIHNAGEGPFSWNLAAHQSWLSLAPASDNKSGIAEIAVDIGLLPPGIYEDTVTVTVPDAIQQPRAIPFRLTVSPRNIEALVGATDSQIYTTSPGNAFFLSRYKCEKTGTLGEIRLKCSSFGNVRVALYTDSNGDPGKLLTSNYKSTYVTAGWNIIPVSEVNVYAESHYWLGFNTSISMVGYPAMPPGETRYKWWKFDEFIFPDYAGTEFTGKAAQMLISGWGRPESLEDN
ncbi:MAG: S8 family serine peptidase [Dehalococcoidia bacterium]|nr:S8 family serine peptidase [Dehalococcoidia bacterium]